MNDNIKEWLGNQPFVVSLQENTPQRRAVITQFSKELSWLFYELKNIFAEKTDHISKYDFYGLLAQAAIEYLDNSNDKVQCDQLLKVVLTKAWSFCEK